MNKNYLKIITKTALLAGLALSLSACGNSAADTEKPQVKDPISVTARSLKDSASLNEILRYSAIVSGDQEAKIIAKTSGTVKNAGFKAGDKVKMGDILLRIDDQTSGGGNAGFNSSQVKAAQIAVSQAYSSYQLAQTNYNNILVSSQKDLAQAAIARDQSLAGKDNTQNTQAEAVKSAELAYETAQAATAAAKLSLDNQKKVLGQTGDDAATNARTAADSAVAAAESIITGINNIASLDDQTPVNIPYKNALGVISPESLAAARIDYLAAKSAAGIYRSGVFGDISARLNSASDLAVKTKTLADAAKTLFNKSIPTADLPQASATGVSLSGLQSQAAGYQAQANAAISAVNGAKQAITNAPLNTQSALDSLEKAYELAQKQEAQAAQNLNNLKAGNKAQSDAAGYGYQSARTAYDSAKTKLDSQIAVAKSQLDIASLQYQNALTALQGLYDIHEAVSPIDGMVTQKLASDGDTVSQGQLIAVVSQPDNVKLTFYTDQDNLPYFHPGQPAEITDSQGASYPGKVTSITPQADALTKRFEIQVRPDQAAPGPDASPVFVLGTVMDASVTITKKAGAPGAALLPLSAIEVGQNGNFVFIAENNAAKKLPAEIIKVEGENAEVKIDAGPDTLLITEGNKLIQEGDPVTVNN